MDNADDLTVIVDMFKAWEDPAKPGFVTPHPLTTPNDGRACLQIKFATLKKGLEIFGKGDTPKESFEEAELTALKAVLGIANDEDYIETATVAGWIDRTNQPHTYARLSDDETHWPKFPNSNYSN